MKELEVIQLMNDAYLPIKDALEVYVSKAEKKRDIEWARSIAFNYYKHLVKDLNEAYYKRPKID